MFNLSWVQVLNPKHHYVKLATYFKFITKAYLWYGGMQITQIALLLNS